MIMVVNEGYCRACQRRGIGDLLLVMYESQRCDVQERWSGAALRCGSVILVQMPLKGGKWALEGEGGH